MASTSAPGPVSSASARVSSASARVSPARRPPGVSGVGGVGPSRPPRARPPRGGGTKPPRRAVLARLRPLGASDVEVSDACLGHASALDDFASEREALDRISAAVHLGVNFLDLYPRSGASSSAAARGASSPGGGPPPSFSNHVERRVARWFALGNHRREDLVLAVGANARQSEALGARLDRVDAAWRAGGIPDRGAAGGAGFESRVAGAAGAAGAAFATSSGGFEGAAFRLP